MEGCSQEVTRRSANHHPSVWGDHFLAYAHLLGANEEEKKQHEELKEEVKKMLVMAPSKSLQKLELINTIQCLGVAYHLEREIEESLSHYKEWIGEGDLHDVALNFRLLRQQGYHVSSDGFRKFTDGQGNYNKALASDVKGLLSLYEAAQFRVHGEEILDEALNFTRTHLKLMLPKLSGSLAQQVSNALNLPLKAAIDRVATRKYISVYQQDESHDEVLLNLAKLDFNNMQVLHKREICDITRWWKELDIAKASPYARDRVVELYFWSLGVYFEPQYSNARKILTKVVCFISVIDDTYDTYGTLDELTLLTEAIQRWNVDAAEQLPPYLKITYLALLDFYNELEKELGNENKSLLVHYSINEMKKLSRAYFQEAKWYYGKNVPTVEQYMKNGIPSSTYLILATTSLLGMAEFATKDAFDWIATEPLIVVASSIIARLTNDVVSHEREVKAGDVSGVECYMNGYGVTKEEAVKKMRKIIENSWKDMNQEYLKPLGIPKALLMTAINLARMAEFAYIDEDGYTVSQNNYEDAISMVLVDPITT